MISLRSIYPILLRMITCTLRLFIILLGIEFYSIMSFLWAQLYNKSMRADWKVFGVTITITDRAIASDDSGNFSISPWNSYRNYNLKY